MTEPALMPTLHEALKNLRHGHIQIIVHEGEIVRIERVERIHLPKPTGEPGGHFKPSS